MTVALILGALAAGSEYSWETMKVILSQQPGRLGVLSGKLLALFNLLLLFALIAFVVGGASSLAVALFSGAPPARPPAIELLGGIGVGALILAVWATFGFVLATLFRSTALAVGLGLIYSFAVEPALSGLSAMNESVAAIIRFFPGASTSTLSFAFEATEDPAFSENFLSPAQSALVLLLYIVAFVLIAALVFRRRDVT